MKIVCTLSDYKYVHQGLTLFNSIKNNNIVLYYLCLDNKTFDKIKSLNLSNLIPIHINSLTEENNKLKNLRDKNYNYFCYSLASYFVNYLFEKNNFESVTYADSDIYFHNDINIIYSEIKDKDLAIFRHRHLPFTLENGEGCFNVGVVYFKNSKISRDVLNWWSDAVLNEKFPPLMTCGDQKYLDLFLILCPSNNILIDGSIGHGAPWHWQLYNFDDYQIDQSIKWGQQKQKLIFSHFSKFKFSEDLQSYLPSSMYYNYTNLKMYKEIKNLNFIYDSYFVHLVNTAKEYNL